MICLPQLLIDTLRFGQEPLPLRNIPERRQVCIFAAPFRFIQVHLGEALLMVQANDLELGGLPGRQRKAEELIQQLPLTPAEEGSRSRIGIEDDTLLVQDQKAISRLLDDAAEVGFRDLQFRGHASPLVDLGLEGFIHLLELLLGEPLLAHILRDRDNP